MFDILLDIPNLEHFDVSSNDLIGTFPRFTSDALRVLDISKNRFHGTLVSGLPSYCGHLNLKFMTHGFAICLCINTIQPVDLFGHYQNREREVGKYFAPYLSNLVKLDISHSKWSTCPIKRKCYTFRWKTN